MEGDKRKINWIPILSLNRAIGRKCPNRKTPEKSGDLIGMSIFVSHKIYEDKIAILFWADSLVCVLQLDVTLHCLLLFYDRKLPWFGSNFDYILFRPIIS